ncbi:MAG: putative quinol monooxygenase [Acidobacteriota bacterium]
MANLTVVATIVAKPGCEKDVEALLTGLVEPSRRDKGCLLYDLHRSADQPGVFLFYETWESKQLLDAHLGTPHLLAMREKLGPLAQSTEIKLLEKIS